MVTDSPVVDMRHILPHQFQLQVQKTVIQVCSGNRLRHFQATHEPLCFRQSKAGRFKAVDHHSPHHHLLMSQDIPPPCGGFFLCRPHKSLYHGQGIFPLDQFISQGRHLGDMDSHYPPTRKGIDNPDMTRPVSFIHNELFRNES